MSKPIGTTRMLVRPLEEGTWGIWRVNEEGIPIGPLLIDPDLEEVTQKAKDLGKILGLPCEVRDKKCMTCGIYTTKLYPFWNGKKDIQICIRCQKTLKKK